MSNPPGKIDYAALREASRMLTRSEDEHRADRPDRPVRQAEKGGNARPTGPDAVRKAKRKDYSTIKLDAVGREAAIHRAVALLGTFTAYYGITVAEMEEERQRMATLSDSRLMGMVDAYQAASSHCMVMLHEDKAREEALKLETKLSIFFARHAASDEDLSVPVRANRTGP